MTGDPKTFDTTLTDPVARIQKYIDAYKNDATYDVSLSELSELRTSCAADEENLRDAKRS